MLLKRITILLTALVVMMTMAVPPVMADPAGGFGGHTDSNEGHKRDDGADFNKGGGQETPKNENRKNGQLED